MGVMSKAAKAQSAGLQMGQAKVLQAGGDDDVIFSLPHLQNLIKRDPRGYEEEFSRRWRHFQSVLALQREQPSADAKEMVANVSFISHVAPCFPKLVAGLPQQLAAFLK